MTGSGIPSRKLAFILLFFLLPCSLLQAMLAHPARAQEAPPVQEIHGKLSPGGIDIFKISGLRRGQTLFVTMENTSGDLDPILALVPASADLPKLIASYRENVKILLQGLEHPMAEIPGLNDATFLAWDDDGGPGYNAALNYLVPLDGDTILVALGSPAASDWGTSGGYRLLLGVDAPEVLDGSAVPTGAVIAVQDESGLGSPGRVQEYTGSLDASQQSMTLSLYDFDPGDTLSIFIKVTSGDLKPILELSDYGGKTVRLGNVQGNNGQTSLEYTFPDGGHAYSLEIFNTSEEGQLTSGEFRLLAGVNDPLVASGAAEPNSQQVLHLPILVQAGFKLQQIVMIDQPNEIMTAVGTIKLAWQDPKLAFSPDTCQCQKKEYTETNFNQFLTETGGDWPDFTFFNQQGNRWALNRVVDIMPDGSVSYVERFSTNFQLNFDFSKYPFDTEHFYINTDMLYPEDRFVLVPMEGFSEIDPENGEDEFILTDFDTSVSSVIASRTYPTSRFTFHFSAPRHRVYYLFRIFIPILLIISVAYITFFLKDFNRRIEVATGNLLLFIAFSWSLAEDYPRMGYLTFVDVIMAITFVVNTLVVIYNVYLKWLEIHGQIELAERIDVVADWIYPLGYIALFGLTAVYFFV
jgi:hypothetical protein